MNFTIIPVAFLLTVFFTSCNSKKSTGENKTEAAEIPNSKKENTIEGAWQTVSFAQNDKSVINNQVKIFSEGVFSLVAWDSSGKLTNAGFGKYEVDGNTYKETFLYHNNPQYTDGQDWQEYEITGDTLIMKGFTKVIVRGKDATVDFPKFVEKRVRVK